MLLSTFRKFTAIAAVCVLAVPAVAQQTIVNTVPSTDTATLSADGNLVGNILANSANEIAKVSNAQVSLVSQGKVIDSVKADEAGNFSFANVNPGPYQIVGSADGLVGSCNVNVTPFDGSQPANPGSVVLTESAPQVVYDSFGTAPVSSFSTGSGGYAAGGSRLGGRLFGGGRLGGRFGGGRFITSPLGIATAAGLGIGLATIDDASPDN